LASFLNGEGRDSSTRLDDWREAEECILQLEFCQLLRDMALDPDNYCVSFSAASRAAVSSAVTGIASCISCPNLTPPLHRSADPPQRASLPRPFGPPPRVTAGAADRARATPQCGARSLRIDCVLKN
jgi:hypothetical protein